jgi:hypothetical protein
VSDAVEVEESNLRRMRLGVGSVSVAPSVTFRIIFVVVRRIRIQKVD